MCNNVELAEKVENMRKSEELAKKLGEFLIAAAREKDVGVVDALLTIGAGDDAQRTKALIWACELNCEKIVDLLLELKVDVTAKNNEAVISASRNANAQIVRKLVEAGADFTAQDNLALTSAALAGKADVVDFLLHQLKEKGIDFKKAGNEALECAIQFKRVKVLIVLFKHGIRLSRESIYSESANLLQEFFQALNK